MRSVTSILTADTDTDSDTDDSYLRYQLQLSGVYVVVCAYRSILPRIDLERYCLFDTSWSNVFLGRSAATIAEICFAGQIALLLNKLGEIHGHPIVQMTSYTIVPAITIAQACCWYGILTLNFLAHAIEETIWAVMSAVVGLLLSTFIIFGTVDAQVWYLSVGGIAAITLYVYFMMKVDVPMYIEKWRTSTRLGKELMSIRIGRQDAWSRRVVTKEWKHWEPEVAWLTGYFSCAVWTSIALVHLSFDGDSGAGIVQEQLMNV